MIEKYLNTQKVQVNVFCTQDSKSIFVGSNFRIFVIPIKTTINSIFRPFALFKAMKLIRATEGVFITFFGDWYEHILLSIGGANYYSPHWPKTHYFRKILRIPSTQVFGNKIVIESENLYSSFQELILKFQVIAGLSEEKISLQNYFLPDRRNVTQKKVVAFSPLGSVRAKELSIENIYSLLKLLDSMQLKVILFCSSSQFVKLSGLLNTFSNIQVCSDIDLGLKEIIKSDCYIGVDTFWAHVAIHSKLPTLVFSGGIPAELIYPNLVSETTFGNFCKFYPCYNTAPCLRLTNKILCLGAEHPHQFLGSVNKFLSSLYN
jgi:ADP-heptose:LPS heptosyltransferase